MSRPSFTGTISKTPTLVGNKARLRPKHLKDVADDYKWYTDAELCHLDAALPITVSLEQYTRNYVEELNYPRKACCLAVETFDGKHIGNCSYFRVDDNKREAELGIMIGDKAYWDQGYGADVIKTLLDHIFLQTGIQRVYLRTLDWNKRAHQCFKKCGFITCGSLINGDHHFIIMEIQRPLKLNKPPKW